MKCKCNHEIRHHYIAIDGKMYCNATRYNARSKQHIRYESGHTTGIVAPGIDVCQCTEFIQEEDV